ncbi:MAG: hypothetical protein ACC628_04795, partial [Pirellulaceae bacterium]
LEITFVLTEQTRPYTVDPAFSARCDDANRLEHAGFVMEPDFDAYKTWLGIPPEEQPPDYYRLLGLTQYEDSRQRIVKASQLRLSHVSRFKNSERGRVAQKLASELSKATSCLLNPNRKQLYDQHLRIGIGAVAAGEKGSAPPRRTEPRPPQRTAAVADKPITVISVLEGRRAKRRQGSRKTVWVITSVGVALLLVAGMGLVFSRDSEVSSSQVAAKSPAPSPTVPSKRSPSELQEPDTPSDTIPKKPSPIAPAQSLDTPDENEPGDDVEDPAASPAMAEITEGDSQPADLSGQDHHGVIHGIEWLADDQALVAAPVSVAAKPAASLAPGAAPGAAPGDDATVAEKRPVPSKEEQKIAQARLDEVFSEELAAAKQPKDHAALAKKLAQLADESNDDVVTQFVLWNEARNQSMLGVDWMTALSMCDRMAARFEVDRRVLHVDTIQRAAEIARSAKQRKSLADQALLLVFDMLREGRFDLADDVAQTSVTVASRSRDADLGKAARRVRDQVNSVKRRWKEAKNVLEQLESDPDDPEWNLVYGRFVCFQQGDWEKGLAYLVKGSNASLTLAAESDRKAPTETGEQIAVADAWYEAAESVERLDRPGVLSRYLFWARRAMPELRGLAKADVEKRIKEVEGTLPDPMRGQKNPPIAGAAPAPGGQFQPPLDFVGLVGRMQIEGVDVGVLWKYECGAGIGKATLSNVMRSIGANPGRVRIELIGLLHVPASATVHVVHQGGTPEAGQAVLAVDDEVLGDVGGGNATRDVYKLDLASGEHTVRWLISGTDAGTCAIQFTDAQSGKPLVVYHNPVMKATLKQTPFPSRLDVNVIK